LHFAAFYCGGAESVERNSRGAPIPISDLLNACDAPKNAVEMVLLLIDKGADMLSETNDGETPQDIATRFERDEIAEILAMAARKEAVRRAQCEAFAMAKQERLGAESWIHELEDGVVKMVLEYV
jgi:hypothetical protein